MSEQLQPENLEAFSLPQVVQLPAQMQQATEGGVAQSRDTFTRFDTAVKQQVRSSFNVLLVAHTGANMVIDRLMSNTSANAEASFDAAIALSSAQSLPEAMRIQADYFKRQSAAVSEQTSEMLELSALTWRRMVETIGISGTTLAAGLLQETAPGLKLEPPRGHLREVGPKALIDETGVQ